MLKAGWRGLAWVLATAWLPASAWAQGATATPPLPTPQFRHYDVSGGLPSSNVYKAVEDAKGRVWMGTANGLVRFDGDHFKVYRHDPRDPHSLPANDLSALIIDRQQHLWVGGDNTGLNLYQPATGTFRTWRHVKGDPGSLAGNDIAALAQGAHGTLWVSLMGVGLDRMDADGRFAHFRHRAGDPSTLASNLIFALRVLKDGTVLAGGFGGLDIMSPDGHVRHVRFKGLSKTPRVWSIDGKPGHLRLATDNGLYRLGADDVARRMLAGIIPAQMMVTSLRGPDGSLWVGSVNGLYWIGPDGRSRFFDPQLQGREGVPGTLIWSLMVDHEGGLWVTTRDGGAAYLCPVWKRFVSFQHQPGNPDELAMTRAVSILAQGNTLLIGGTDGSIDRVNPATGKVTHRKISIQHESVTAMGHAGGQDLWIARTRGFSLLEHDRVRTIGAKRFPGGVNRIVTDKHFDAYVSAPSGGVFFINRKTLAIEALKSTRGNPHDRDIRGMHIHQGRLWVASVGGLLRQGDDRDTLEPVPGVPEGRVDGFAFDDHGFWLVRPDRLEHYQLKDGRAVRDREIGVDQGWPEVKVVAMFSDASDRVWMTTNTGLWRYNPADGSFRSFGVEDGLPSPEFTTHNLARLPDGTKYAGTLQGVVGWNPANVVRKARPPRLLLESVTAMRHGHRHAFPVDGGPIQLRWNDHGLHVSMQALSYLDPARNHYRFRLDGLDTDWVATGGRGERDFTGLAHGDYVLHMEAAGPSGAWSALEPLVINVARPPWITWWAWLSYVLVAAAAIATAAMLARRRIEQRHRMQLAESERAMAEKASAAKTSFLATLGHEIRTPMTGVLGMAELLLRSPLEPRQRQYAETIQRSGTLLLRLVNEALDMARIEAGRLELELAPFDPRELVRDVAQLESSVAGEKGLRLTTRVMDRVPARVHGDALRIKQILLNLVNNALKFTISGGIVLELDWIDHGLSFSVVDSGPGIPEDSRERLFQRYEQADSPQRSSGSGLGLAICRELATLMGGHCDLLSSSEEGSTFRVWLPLSVVEAVGTATDHATDHASHWRLLLVEDDITVAGVISGLLEDMGHRVCHASQSLAALSEIDNGRFDAILLDLDLPGLDGFALSRMLRERGMTLPIIAVTARSGGNEDAQARAAGMDGFLRKPLSGEQLGEALRAVLD